MRYVAITDVEDDDDYKVYEFNGDPVSFVGLMNLIYNLDDRDTLVIKCYEERS